MNRIHGSHSRKGRHDLDDPAFVEVFGADLVGPRAARFSSMKKRP
jgi:hypothetical protein